MTTHSSILACRIPWTEETVGLQPRGPQRVRHNLATIMEAKKLNMAEKATKDKIPFLLYFGKIYAT